MINLNKRNEILKDFKLKGKFLLLLFIQKEHINYKYLHLLILNKTHHFHL